MTTVNQPPARYARHLARVARVRAAGLYLVTLGSILGLYETTVRPAGASRDLRLVLGAAAVLSAVLARRASTAAQRASRGVVSERRVATALTRLRPTALYNNLLLGAGGDADHVVVGPWLAVVETKTGRGHVSCDEAGVRVGTRRIPGDPLAQVRRQADALSRRLNRHVTPILCVVDMYGPPQSVRGITVCSLGDLANVVRVTPALTVLDVERVCRALSTLPREDLARQ